MTDALFQSTKNTIMVVDDDPDLVTLLRARLEQREFNVMCAYNGSQALAVWRLIAMSPGVGTFPCKAASLRTSPLTR